MNKAAEDRMQKGIFTGIIERRKQQFFCGVTF
jgi:hypothetical protein